MNFIAKTVFLFVSITASQLYASEPDWVEVRELYYKSLDQKGTIDSTIEFFRNLKADKNNGLIDTYIGSLVAVKAKHAWLPTKKLSLAKEGLQLMDRGLEKNTNNIEALFIHGSTCFYLPFFFNRKDDAHLDFRKIVQLLPDQYEQYPIELVRNVVEFIEKNVELNENELANIMQVKESISDEI